MHTFTLWGENMPKTADVSMRALEARVNRALDKDGQALRKCREDSRWYSELGDYYIVNYHTSAIDAKHCDVEALARELGVLKDREAPAAA